MLMTAPTAAVCSRFLSRVGNCATQPPKKIPEGPRSRHVSPNHQRADA
jgi:hypothetical protein